MSVSFIRPPRLKPGARVAALSLSSGFVTEVMARYQAGVRQCAKEFGWEVVPTPNALRGPDFLYENPQARADDLHWALENPDVHGLVSIIGGDDSIRVLPHLELETIRRHPKVFLGYSDSTVTLLQFLRAGVMAYHGPALLTDLAESGGMNPFVVEGVRRALINDPEPFDLMPAPEWTELHQPWTPELQDTRRSHQPGEGWTWLQGTEPAEGHLIGGCAEVLDMLNGARPAGLTRKCGAAQSWCWKLQRTCRRPLRWGTGSGITPRRAFSRVCPGCCWPARAGTPWGRNTTCTPG